MSSTDCHRLPPAPPLRRTAACGCRAGRSSASREAFAAFRAQPRPSRRVWPARRRAGAAARGRKPKAVSTSPPVPRRAKRLPLALSLRMISPASTSAARCRRSVDGAMPWARSESCTFDGKTTTDRHRAALSEDGSSARRRAPRGSQIEGREAPSRRRHRERPSICQPSCCPTARQPPAALGQGQA